MLNYTTDYPQSQTRFVTKCYSSLTFVMKVKRTIRSKTTSLPPYSALRSRLGQRPDWSHELSSGLDQNKECDWSRTAIRLEVRRFGKRPRRDEAWLDANCGTDTVIAAAQPSPVDP